MIYSLKPKNEGLKLLQVEQTCKLIFWKLSQKTVIILDIILDSNENMLFTRKIAFICSKDAHVDSKLRPIKIVENEIWVFNYDKKLNK